MTTPQEAARQFCIDKLGMVRPNQKLVEDMAALLIERENARENAVREECAVAAEQAKLPPEYDWGCDAMEQFNFGKKRAAQAIRSTARGK